MTRREIVSLLKKYYVNYNVSKWKKFISSPKMSIENDFNKLWKNEHGGYISAELLAKLKSDKTFLPRRLPQGPLHLPKMNRRRLIIPEIPSNDKSFQKKYVKLANKMLLAFDDDHLYIDLRNNGGGKPHVMIAALLPIFNTTFHKKTTTLTYIRTANSKFVPDVIYTPGCIKSNVNDNAKICGTKRAMKHPLKKITIHYNQNTASAAEQTIIALRALAPSIKIIMKGPTQSAGLTTAIKYFELSDGSGIEIPYGYMADVEHNVFYKGV